MTQSAIASLLLRGACSLRALELMLDSLLGQTASCFILRAPQAALGEDGAALMRRYGDPRFQFGDAPDPHTPFIGVVEAGCVLAPTWLARLAAALDGAPEAACASCAAALFDGAWLGAAPSGPAASGRCSAGLLCRPMRGGTTPRCTRRAPRLAAPSPSLTGW